MGNSENQKKRANQRMGQFNKRPAQVVVEVVQRTESRRRSSSHDRHRSRSRRPSRRPQSPPRRPIPEHCPNLPVADADYLANNYRREFEKAQQHVAVLTQTNHELEEKLKKAQDLIESLGNALSNKFAIDNQSLETVLLDVITPQVKAGIKTVLKSDDVKKALEALQAQKFG